MPTAECLQSVLVLMLERRVALKIVPTDRAAAAEQVLAEARAAAALNHPNVCAVHAVDVDTSPSATSREVRRWLRARDWRHG